MFRVSLLLFFAIPLMTITSAQAGSGKIVHCGFPVETNIETDPGHDFCDIYTRQLAYKEKRDSFMDDLLERQKNFAEPSIQASRKYREDLDALNEARAKEAGK